MFQCSKLENNETFDYSKIFSDNYDENLEIATLAYKLFKKRQVLLDEDRNKGQVREGVAARAGPGAVGTGTALSTCSAAAPVACVSPRRGAPSAAGSMPTDAGSCGGAAGSSCCGGVTSTATQVSRVLR